MIQPASAPTYGYIRWRSTLTGKEGGGTKPVADPSFHVSVLNRAFPELKHWFIPA